MSVTVNISKGEHNILWRNFVAHMDRRVMERCQGFEGIEEEMAQELATHGAHINWQHNCVWFPDQASLAQFVLTWSKN